MIRQKRAEGVFYIIGAIMAPAIFYIWYKYIIKKLWALDDSDANIFGWVVCIALGLATTAITPLCLYWGITYLISPEYYAVMDMIEKVYSATHHYSL